MKMTHEYQDKEHVIAVTWGNERYIVRVSEDGGVVISPAAPDGTPDLLAGKQVWVDPYGLHNPDMSENPEEPALLVHSYHDDNDEPVTLRLRKASIHMSNDAGSTLSAEENCTLNTL